MREHLSLNGDWELFFCVEDGAQPQTPEELRSSQLAPISAVVPGNVELDLQRADLAPDPYYADHIYQFRKYEFYTWWYQRHFSCPKLEVGQTLYLCFEGLDTIADIWLNGQKVGRCENGLVPCELAVTHALLPNDNMLQVHIFSAVNHARRTEYPAALCVSESVGDERLALRKAPHCFGWDIAPRLLSAGIWRDVSLCVRNSTALTEVYLATVKATQAQASVDLRYRFQTDDCSLSGFHVRVSGVCGASAFVVESPALFTAGRIGIVIEHPQLWWPHGYGDAALYEVTVELMQHDAVIDTHCCRFGVRVIDIARSYEKQDAGEFLIRVNAVPIMVKGTNWVPLDCLHSRDAARLETAHALLRDIGCNLVRCWGGNVYESDRFFDLCDKHGILVWQDFAFACGIYNQGEDYARIVEAEAARVIRRLRNHASLALWAGDNEVDQFYSNIGYFLPHARYNRISRETLPRAIAMHDPYREYIESSPFIPAGETDEYAVPEQHNWGPRDYFKGDFYKNSTAHFISEIGYHGCPSQASLARYIPADELGQFVTGASLRTHSTEYLPALSREYSRNELMLKQIQTMFGAIPDTPEALTLASQISQAEAKKYFIESTRMKKWRRSGIIWWNLLDGWPQISDAVVDYYFDKKLAYSYIKRSQQPICMMMDEAHAWEHRVILANDSCTDAKVSYAVFCADTGEKQMEGSCLSKANENLFLRSIPCIPGEQRLYLMRWTIGKRTYENHYISGFAPYALEKYHTWLEKIKQFCDVVN